MGAFRGALGWSGSRTRNVIGGNERRTVEDFGGAEDIEEPPRITSGFDELLGGTCLSSCSCFGL
jgi:hypothetical protein